MTWSSGTIHETCSCGAEIGIPDTTTGREELHEWRRSHRHDKPRPELKSLKTPNLPPVPYRPETDLTWSVRS